MINLSEKEFRKHKKTEKTFPIYLKVNADQLTPIGIYCSLKGKKKFLLETVYSEREIGRYSFLGIDPYLEIKSSQEEVVIGGESEVKKYKGRVLDYVKKHMNFQYEEAGLNLPFTGGAVGYVGYDVIRQYEKLPLINKDEINIPEAYLMFYKTFISYDHFEHKMNIVYNVFPEDGEEYEAIVLKLKSLYSMVKESGKFYELKEGDVKKELQSNFTQDKFCSMVKKAKEYIKSGDIFQVVLSQRLKFKTSSNPFDVYRKLRSKNPSPYLFFIDFGDFQIAGSSPETLVTVNGNEVKTNPIAGTRPRGKNPEEDIQLKAELLGDEKEKAEHIMLVDLGRNDIGRISEFGTVKLDRFMEVDFYSHVMHIASMVSGKLKKNLTCFDALSSCLPVGTVSGAPKIRAMEIIDEIEDTARGIYAGAVGYFSYNGSSTRALKNGAKISGIMSAVKDIRKKSQVPLVYLVYYNSVFKYGMEKFIMECSYAGVDGIIIPDLPIEERKDIIEISDKYGVYLIPLVAPTSKERIKKITHQGKGFVYCVSTNGVTGVRQEIGTDIKEYMDIVSRYTDMPKALGFGISNAEMADKYKEHCDAIIVGSALIKKIAEAGNVKEAVENAAKFVSDIKKHC